ncbi:sodium-independent anion transporter [Winogradskyella sp. PC-19]|uniref:SulP family inorganic anion transporter n=1 Tax=unclassified Winogradskyella TaxID=2615021 RepID=UPI000B3CF1B6|nr:MULTISPECIES: SulP family inorganic anion transporter [unclassified Winogradskyella]ARV09883.1 sodium-independent anion transporter [Winogradskyella sp. PC-19]RZN84417.1 MAG: SulP family inorganic anion transporter [Winogradskyella sp.]
MLSNFFDFKNLKGDFTGGLVAGVVALPLALAFGVQSGMGATAGLYGAIAVGIFAAMFGGTETQASGPTGPMTVVSAALVAAAIEITGSLENAMSIILLSFLLGGLFQIIFGFLNIAGYVKYFPYPVVSGFMSGVGLIIVILQLFPFAGLDSAKSTTAVVKDFPRLFAEFNISALLLGAITIAVYFVFPKINKAIPSALVALIVATLIAYFFKMDVPLIGEIPSGLPSFQLGGILEVDSSAWGIIIEYAIVLAVLGSIDSLLTSVIADNMTKTKHNSNRELIGQGIGNMLAAAIGGIPGAGATKGTVVNINAGGRTRLSGILHGIFLLTVLLGLGQLASLIPLCVLAGLLIPIGFKIIDFKGLKHLLKVPRADAVVLILVLAITTFGSLIQAVGVGVALACLLFMKKSGDISEKGLEVGAVADIDGSKPWQDEIEFYEDYKKKVIIKHLYGPLFFGFTSYFKDQIKALPDEVEAVIMRMDRVPYIDQSGLYTLEDVIYDLREQNIEVLLIGLKEQPKDMLEAVDVIPDLVPLEDVFENIEDGFVYLKSKLKK